MSVLFDLEGLHATDVPGVVTSCYLTRRDGQRFACTMRDVDTRLSSQPMLAAEIAGGGLYGGPGLVPFGQMILY